MLNNLINCAIYNSPASPRVNKNYRNELILEKNSHTFSSRGRNGIRSMSHYPTIPKSVPFALPPTSISSSRKHNFQQAPKSSSSTSKSSSEQSSLQSNSFRHHHEPSCNHQQQQDVTNHNESNNSNINQIVTSSVSSVLEVTESLLTGGGGDNLSIQSQSDVGVCGEQQATSRRGSDNKSSDHQMTPTNQQNNVMSAAEVLGIKPELYKHSAEIDLPPSRIGRVWFKLVYDGAVETLTVEVLKVKQLLPRDHSNTPRDSFVKLFLLPDERFSQQTKVRQRTNNPTFGEKFVFQVSNTEVKRRCLRLSVYDAAKGMRHLIGHALVSLKEIDPSTEEDYLWRDLDDIAHTGDTGTSLGELNIGLSYIPNLNRLNVVIIKARNLRKIDLQSNGIYVKVALTQGHSIIKTKCTAVQDGALDLHFNESFSFKIPPEDVDKSCISIIVLTTRSRGTVNQAVSSFKSLITRGKYGAAHKYGRVAIGSFMYCRGAQLMHWQDAISRSCQICTRWHPLSEVIESL